MHRNRTCRAEASETKRNRGGQSIRQPAGLLSATIFNLGVPRVLQVSVLLRGHIFPGRDFLR